MESTNQNEKLVFTLAEAKIREKGILIISIK
jgi:hypothetical protein